MNSKKICVIGAGQWGLNHIRTLDELGALGGVVDIDTKKLDSIREKYPNVNTLNNIEEGGLGGNTQA